MGATNMNETMLKGASYGYTYINLKYGRFVYEAGGITEIRGLEQ